VAREDAAHPVPSEHERHDDEQRVDVDLPDPSRGIGGRVALALGAGRGPGLLCHPHARHGAIRRAGKATSIMIIKIISTG
jgi:hypothetical protein